MNIITPPPTYYILSNLKTTSYSYCYENVAVGKRRIQADCYLMKIVKQLCVCGGGGKVCVCVYIYI